MIVLHKELQKTVVTEVNLIPINKMEIPVYETKISQMGLLGASLAADLSEIYSTITFKTAQLDQKFPIHMIITLEENIIRMAPALDQDILHVCNRLQAFELGHPDPGTLSAQRHKRKEARQAEAPPDG